MSLLSNKARRNLIRILPFGIIWFLSSSIFLAIEHLSREDMVDFNKTDITLDLEMLVFALVSVGFVGILVGCIEVFFLNRLFIKKSFFQKILFKLLFYGIFMFLIILVFFPIASSLETETSLWSSFHWNRYLDFLKSDAYLNAQLQLATTLSMSLFYFEISENMGPKKLLNFLFGKYHQAQEEERVFMFADMRSSTSIAEHLGHLRYYDLLRDYYSCFSSAIVKYGGQLYEYVGDEIIVSWKANSKQDPANALLCYQAMQENLSKRARFFEKKYGIIPEFKAGLHLGRVTIGEVGELKKEIMYTGDVLNTCARIQSLCNEFQVKVLFSKELLAHFKQGIKFDVREMGERSLRGREQPIQLYTLQEEQ